MASRACKPEEYFRRQSVVAKSSKQSLKQSEDNSADISRKDPDDHEPESIQGKAARLRKLWKRACHVKKSKNQRIQRENENRPWRLNTQQKDLRSGHGHR